MRKELAYNKIFALLVERTAKYIINNNIQAMILGISGGIDSTVCAAICSEVSKITGVPLIGRSLPTRYNKESEISTADLVGNAFCTDYKVAPIDGLYRDTLTHILSIEEPYGELGKQTPVANGNIQARLRMIYLYNLASINKGIVIDTDNLTEHNLGYWTLHGDVGDLNPIGDLWKTEIFKLAKTIQHMYQFWNENLIKTKSLNCKEKALAIERSLKLTPTAGLGITNSDLEELDAESYEQVDIILQKILKWKNWLKTQKRVYKDIDEVKNKFLMSLSIEIPHKVVHNIVNRHFASDFKRNKLPVVIDLSENDKVWKYE